ncbi:hypothetical protein B0O44_104265 [Pedobacter nutrimenti]|uniref:Uncharacterized protein n=1 Tax=Pedobacter nutrimenti TaxID=1241337 RepID=A0A318UCI9_9SPHI|nr:hypothetical protein B0O44_104265 [Pedobacter nutrimenti]
MVYKPTFDPKLKINAPRREFYFELKEDTIGNPKQILALFKKYEMSRTFNK